MFAKLHQSAHDLQNHREYHHHHHQLTPQTTTHHSYQVTAGEKSSEDAGQLTASQPISAVPSTINDGASIEISRRPRGRPAGSKNKPKPPVFITIDAEPSMSPYLLELPSGVDIISSVSRFCRRRNIGLCILTGSGTVSDVTFRQPTTAPGPNVIFHGRFDILSISATVLHPNASSGWRAEDFTISLAGPRGQVVGGPVVGPLTSAGPVYLIAATFNKPLYQRLPAGEEVGNSGGGGNEGGRSSPPASISGEVESGGLTAAEEPRRLQMYSSHMGSDLMWAPTARQAAPPY